MVSTRHIWAVAERPGTAAAGRGREAWSGASTLGDAGDSGGSVRPVMSAPLLVACPSPLCAGPPLPAPPAPPEPRLIRLVSGDEPGSFSPDPPEPLLAPALLHLLLFPQTPNSAPRRQAQRTVAQQLEHTDNLHCL